MDLEELLTLTAASIYAKMRPESWQEPETTEALMKIALDEAKKLWKIVNANPSVWTE